VFLVYIRRPTKTTPLYLQTILPSIRLIRITKVLSGFPRDTIQFSTKKNIIPTVRATRNMSHIISGAPNPKDQGQFKRADSGHRHWVRAGDGTYPAEANRYHLYIAYACPWANRTLSVLKMKGLEGVVGVSIVHPTMQRTRPHDESDQHAGWTFDIGELTNSNGFGKFIGHGTVDRVHGKRFLRDIYELAGDTFGKYTTPLLFDTKTNTIVNNESSEIIRMLTKEFDEWATGPFALLDLYPEPLREEIDTANSWIYPGINNGVYRSGFAASQEAYDGAVSEVEAAFNRLEELLGRQRYVVGNTFTEADLRLFHTLVRFDEVYNVHFKCNFGTLRDYPNILDYCRDVYQFYGIADSIQMDDIKIHYYS
jgi:putative glutathione S-transferase